jgi:FkbM family methyltransferase
MSEVVLDISFRDRLLIWACRRSFRIRSRNRFTISYSQNNKRIHIPLINGLGWDLLNPPVILWHSGDAQIQGVISKLYNDGRRGCFVDIGANQGRMIVNLQTLGLMDLSYIGFEPLLSGAYYISQLIKLNNLKGHHVLPIALGSNNSMVRFYRSSEIDVGASYTLEAYPLQRYTETTLVPISTADDQLAALPHDIFLVKIDTEGSEYSVLQGMTYIINTRRPPVYFEVMGYRPVEDGSYSRNYLGGELSEEELKRLSINRRANMSNLEKFWKGWDYSLYFIQHDGRLRPVTSIDPGPESNDNRSEMNFLALPD